MSQLNDMNFQDTTKDTFIRDLIKYTSDRNAGSKPTHAMVISITSTLDEKENEMIKKYILNFITRSKFTHTIDNDIDEISIGWEYSGIEESNVYFTKTRLAGSYIQALTRKSINILYQDTLSIFNISKDELKIDYIVLKLLQ